MNILHAMDDTIKLVRKRGMPDKNPNTAPWCFAHLENMTLRARTEPDMSYGKLCRWLGYIQGVIVARGYATLEEVKEINRQHSDHETHKKT